MGSLCKIGLSKSYWTICGIDTFTIFYQTEHRPNPKEDGYLNCIRYTTNYATTSTSKQTNN